MKTAWQVGLEFRFQRLKKQIRKVNNLLDAMPHSKAKACTSLNSFKAQISFSSDTCKVSWIQISSRDYSFHSTSTTSIFFELKISVVFDNGQGYFKGFPPCCVDADATPLGQSRARFPGSAARREKRWSVRFLLYTKTGSRLMCAVHPACPVDSFNVPWSSTMALFAWGDTKAHGYSLSPSSQA